MRGRYGEAEELEEKNNKDKETQTEEEESEAEDRQRQKGVGKRDGGSRGGRGRGGVSAASQVCVREKVSRMCPALPRPHPRVRLPSLPRQGGHGLAWAFPGRRDPRGQETQCRRQA